MTLLIGFVTIALLVTSSALMQSQKQTSASEIRSQLGLLEDPHAGYISKSARHKLIIEQGDQQSAAYTELKSRGSIVEEFDYGSFRMVVVDEYAAGGLEHLLQMQATIRDDMNLIRLGGYELDTTSPEATLSQLPVELRQTDMADAIARGTEPAGGLYIMQFVGPIQEAWLVALEGTGAEVVSYLSANAYVVSADKRAATKLLRLKNKKSFVQFLGDYEPAFRLSADGQPAEAGAQSGKLKKDSLNADFLNKHQKPSPAMQRAEQALSPGQSREEAVSALSSSDQTGRFTLDQTQVLSATGETTRLSGRIVDSTKPTRLALAWTSPTGTLSRAAVVNDLDIEVQINGATYKGNVFAEGVSAIGGRADSFNSLEAIILPAGMDGEFTLTVRAANLAGDGVPDKSGRTDQDFALATVNAAVCPSVSTSPFSFNLTAVEGVPSFSTRFISVSSNPSDVAFSARPDLFSLWISVDSCAFCRTPGSVTFRAPYPFGLSRGFYSGSVEILVSGCTFPNNVSVNLNVVPPSIFVSPVSLSFTAPAGGPNPANQSFTISTNTNAIGWSASSNASWLTASPASGTAASSSTVSVGVNVAGLAPGTYTGAITVSSASAGNSPRTVQVTLNVATPQIGVNPTSLTFTTGSGGANPPGKTISITNTGVGTLNWTATDNRPWITVSPTSGTAPSTLTVSVNKAGLPLGTHTGTVTITAPGASNSPLNIPITLSISNTPVITVSPASLFFVSRNGAVPLPKTVSISNGGGGTLNWSASSNAFWLMVSPTSGTAPSTLTVSVDPSSLDIGSYQGTITITAPGASPVTIVVTLSVIERIRPPIEP